MEKQKIIKNVGALAIQKIGSTISISLDTIIISAFLNLTVVAMYSNYNYIISSISSFVILVYGSVTAGIGNSMVLETKRKNYLIFNKFVFLNTWLVGWCSICFMCLFQPFMVLWVGYELMLSVSTVLCIVVCFYIKQIRRPIMTYKDAAGMWWADRYKPIAGCIVNLVFNIMLVKTVGVAGVVISTIISYLFIELPWETHVLFKRYFERKEWNYYLKLGYMTITVIIAGLVTYWICMIVTINGVLGLGVKMVICIIVPNILLILLNFKRDDFEGSATMVKSIFTSMIKKAA